MKELNFPKQTFVIFRLNMGTCPFTISKIVNMVLKFVQLRCQASPVLGWLVCIHEGVVLPTDYQTGKFFFTFGRILCTLYVYAVRNISGMGNANFENVRVPLPAGFSVYKNFLVLDLVKLRIGKFHHYCAAIALNCELSISSLSLQTPRTKIRLNPNRKCSALRTHVG